MLPPLTRSNLPVPRGQAEWPERPTREHQLTGALFEQRPPLRLLTALIDADLLPTPGAAFNEDVVLAGLLAHPYVKFLRYRDEGPFPDVQRRASGVPGSSRTIAEGWAELLPPAGRDVQDVILHFRARKDVS